MLLVTLGCVCYELGPFCGPFLSGGGAGDPVHISSMTFATGATPSGSPIGQADMTMPESMMPTLTPAPVQPLANYLVAQGLAAAPLGLVAAGLAAADWDSEVALALLSQAISQLPEAQEL